MRADLSGNLGGYIEGGQYLVDVPALGVTDRLVDATPGSHAAGTAAVHGIVDTAVLVTSGDVTEIVVLTQAAYDLLTPDAAALYVVVG